MSAAILAAIDRVDVAHYVQTLITVYIVLIFIRIVIAWIPRMPHNRYLSAVIGFVSEVVDPYLNLFRRFLPMARLGPAALDLSPMVGTIVLIVVGNIVAAAIAG